ncbi:hypothetical protein [Streptomyces sp. F-3]|uniref:hypothetical protein n=1 Tax=Streptomyces sp. F-3 TaxID=1840095 RepID=UPI00082DCE84|nr:hypothetical protein [Streptomyces sp. F-3]
MPFPAQTTQATNWPAGVVARYLTVANATVDITTTIVNRRKNERGTEVIDVAIAATCAGCRDTDSDRFDGLFPHAINGLVDTHYGRDIRTWAQEHAERCRAMPRPEAAR